MDHLGARAFVETDFFCWHCCFLLYSKLVGGYAPSMTPMMSSSRITSSSSPLPLTITRSCNGRIFMRNSPYKMMDYNGLHAYKPEFADPERRLALNRVEC